MLRFSDDFYYNKNHLWILPEEDNSVLIGVTQVLITISGDPDEVEFMAVEGETIKIGRPLARLLTEDDEWEVLAPFNGTIIGFNIEVADHPESVADDPYDEGWLVRMKPADQAALDQLLNANDYEDHVVDQLAEIEEDLLEDEDEFVDDEGLDAGEGFDDEEDDEDKEEEDDY